MKDFKKLSEEDKDRIMKLTEDYLGRFPDPPSIQAIKDTAISIAEPDILKGEQGMPHMFVYFPPNPEERAKGIEHALTVMAFMDFPREGKKKYNIISGGIIKASADVGLPPLAVCICYEAWTVDTSLIPKGLSKAEMQEVMDTPPSESPYKADALVLNYTDVKTRKLGMSSAKVIKNEDKGWLYDWRDIVVGEDGCTASGNIVDGIIHGMARALAACLAKHYSPPDMPMPKPEMGQA